MITDKTIEQLQEAVQPTLVNTERGEMFSSRPLHALPKDKRPEPETLGIATLKGFCDYVRSKFDNPKDHERMVWIKDQAEVRLVSELYPPSKQRDSIVAATVHNVFGPSFSGTSPSRTIHGRSISSTKPCSPRRRIS